MDYATLQTTILDWADRDELTTFVVTAIELAEAGFNHGIAAGGVSPLRVREMVAVDDLTPTSGACTLPTDYLQYRRVVEKASIRRELSYVPPSVADQAYNDRASGLASSFTIIGSSLYMYPVSGNDIELTYYQAIPALSDSNTSNWLLAKHPSLYIHAALYQIGLYVRDDDLAMKSAALTASIVTGLNATDTLANYARAQVRMQQQTP